MECGYSTNPADRLNEAVISRFFRIESYAALSRPLSRPPTSKRAAVSSCPFCDIRGRAVERVMGLVHRLRSSRTNRSRSVAGGASRGRNPARPWGFRSGAGHVTEASVGNWSELICCRRRSATLVSTNGMHPTRGERGRHEPWEAHGTGSLRGCRTRPATRGASPRRHHGPGHRELQRPHGER